MMRLVLRGTPTLCLAAVCVFTQPAQAQLGTTKRLRFETGYSSNHDGSDNSIGGAVRFGFSRAPDDLLRFEAGLIAGDPYAGLDAGIEVRFPQRARLGVALRGGGGLLVEDGYAGAFVRGGGGLELDVSPRVALRATVQAAFHGGQGGPHHAYFGFDYRW